MENKKHNFNSFLFWVMQGPILDGLDTFTWELYDDYAEIYNKDVEEYRQIITDIVADAICIWKSGIFSDVIEAVTSVYFPYEKPEVWLERVINHINNFDMGSFLDKIDKYKEMWNPENDRYSIIYPGGPNDRMKAFIWDSYNKCRMVIDEPFIIYYLIKFNMEYNLPEVRRIHDTEIWQKRINMFCTD